MVAKNDSKLPGNGGWVAPTTTANSQPSTLSQRRNASTPVVSLLKLQQMGEELDICPSKKSSSPTIQDYVTTPPPQQTFYQQVPPPVLNQNKSQAPLMPILYQSVPPMFVTATGQPSGTSPYMNQFLPPGAVNGHSDHSGTNCPGQFQNHRAPYTSKPYIHRRGGGTSSGNQSSVSVHIPPFPPKFHFMNGNHMPMSGFHNPHTQGSSQRRHYNNRNLNQQHRGRDSGRYAGPNSGRMQRRFFVNPVNSVNKNPSPNAVATSNGNATAEASVSHATASVATTTTTVTATATAPITTSAVTIMCDAPSPPPAPYSPMTNPANDFSSPPQQVQLYSGGGYSVSRQAYYPPSNGAQQHIALPPRRFVGSSRKSGSSVPNGGSTPNNGTSRNNGGSSGKNSKKMVLSSGASKVVGSDEGGEDAPAMVPHPSCGAVMQETCHQLQTLSL
jgi:hypothetical protein